MDPRPLLCRLLHRAFLDVRVEANEIKNGRVFAIADLFHAIPLQMERAERGEISYDDILNGLTEKARAKNTLQWLDNAIDNVSHGDRPDPGPK